MSGAPAGSVPELVLGFAELTRETACQERAAPHGDACEVRGYGGNRIMLRQDVVRTESPRQRMRGNLEI